MEVERHPSLRQATHDYSGAGFYFVTVVTESRLHLFGRVDDGQVTLSAAGEMVSRRLREIETTFPDAILDSSMVMPNHVHAVIELRPGTSDTRPRAIVPPGAALRSVAAPRPRARSRRSCSGSRA